tara:strand:+ start:54 stop:1415 length:1362 start_codon:yes stop_codon:yes gene_type:complete
MASTIVSRTQSGSESAAGRRTWTFSCWFKRTGISSSQELFGSDANGARSNNYNIIDFNSSDQLDFGGYESGTTFRKITNRVFRDINAWYHLVIAFDTTQSTADDRIKIYINGTRETSFGTSTNPAQDYQSKFFSSGKVHAFGRSSQTFDGVISHCHATEGTAYAPTVFGSTDATTGEWKINASPSVSYGTNGFFLFKNDNAVTNQAGNSSGNFAVTAGTLTKTEDNPSNIFCTMNPLMNYSNGTPLFNLGNNRIRGGGSAWLKSIGTLGNRTGKFYYEAKINTYYGDGRPVRIGWDSIDLPRTGTTTYYSGFNISSDGFIRGGVKGVNAYDPNATSLGGSFTGGDFLGFAIDLDNDLIYAYKNGTVFSNVNGLDISGNTNCSIKNSRGHQVSPSCNWYSTNDSDNIIDFNFGNGVFGDTQLTGTTYNDSQGNGIFKYQPPTNYLCWSTKSFNV